MTQDIRTIRNRKARRGVTLLLVLGLMTMFAMLVVTFMVVTTQAMKTSESTAKLALKYGGALNLGGLSGGKSIPQPDFNLAIDALLVGGQTPGGLDTIIGPHSILENLYGHPDADSSANLKGIVTYNATDIIDTPSESGSSNTVSIAIKVHVQFDTGYNYGDYHIADLIGGVLTLTNSGKSALVTNAVVDVPNWDDGSGNGEIELYVAPLNFADFKSALDDGNNVECIINTPAFSGTGPGYYRDSSYADGGALLALRDGDIANDGQFSGTGGGGYELALRPNILAPSQDSSNAYFQPYKKYLENNVVLTNPDYTAPDYLNMFLAWNEVKETSGSYHIDHVIPSFHRPSLVRYWFGTNPSGTSIENLRKVVLRPLKQDHPNFTGSNAAANVADADEEASFLIYGPWDVDNDGDGIQDGIWLDLGAEPVEIGGQLLKPLYSFYVLEMDGRLNMNAHGMSKPAAIGTGSVDDDGGLDIYGLGAGVAEIRLEDGLTNLDLTQLLEGNSDRKGRYSSTNTADDPVPGDVNDNKDSHLTTGTVTQLMKTMGISHLAYALPSDSNITGYTGYTNGYGSLLPDFFGTAAILFDELGNRKFELNAPYFAQNPYMMNPYGDDLTDTNDSPFQGNDLEFILRSVGDKSFHDVLSTTRLRHLIDSNNDYANDVEKFSAYRHFITTRSSDIPAAARSGLKGYRGIFEYLNAEFPTEAEKLLKLLPLELLRGEKVSLDRIMFLEASITDRTELLRQKIRFAQEMFYLVMVLCPEIMDNANTIERKINIARLAQWCVNLVDFLDADDVMTPLVFNETDPLNDPFDLTAGFDGFYNGTNNPVSPGRRLIWGMEQPEVALTKTFATHNRRVADSKHGYDVEVDEENADLRDQIHKDVKHDEDNPCECEVHLNRIAKMCSCGATTPSSDLHKHDETFDQVMIPQGSLFLELYRVGNPGRTYYEKGIGDKGNLYVQDADSDNNLDLGKTDGGSPVWRLAIGKATRQKPKEEGGGGEGGGSGEIKDHLFKAAEANPKEYDFQPGTNSCTVELERFIWFCGKIEAEATLTGQTLEDNTTTWESCSYFNLGNENGKAEKSLPLGVNEYLVIGPRLFTSFLSLPVDDDSEEAPEGKAAEFGTPDESEDTFIDLRTIAEGTDSRVKVMVAGVEGTATSQPLGPTGISGVGVSVSEPLPNSTDYYDPPDGAASPKMISKSLGTSGGSEGSEGSEGSGETGGTFNDKYIGHSDCNTIMQKEEFKPGFGTISCYRSIFLQRLADPGRPHNDVTNPYITVDWNMIDLHVFNSEEDSNGLPPESDPALEESEGGFNVQNGLYFEMRQWGYTAGVSDSDLPNIWDRTFPDNLVDDVKDGLEATGSDKIKMEDMVLGRLNIKGFSADTSGGGGGEGGGTGSASEYTGAPNKAFLHFPWNNGPFTNTYELMLVPACSPGRFGFEFHMQGTTSYASEWWKLVPSLGNEKGTDDKTMPICNTACNIGPYLNFFKTKDSNSSVDEPVLGRLFDFVRVPSRFNGSLQGIADDPLDPSIITSTSWDRPVYKMREPGKINLNTVNEPAWAALQMSASYWAAYDHDPDSNEPADPKSSFRRSWLGVDFENDNLPTEFSRPFRSAWAGALVPPIKNGTLVQTGSTATVLSKTGETDPTDSTVVRLLFEPHKPGDTTELDPGGGDPQIIKSKATNQLTALEDAIRRSNMLTNRSNVFAVWVTVGYFKVEKFSKSNLDDGTNADLKHVYSGKLNHINANNFDAIYSTGGYVLGEERGLDDGSVARHRYFYLIDRSVPVGFRRGDTKLNHKDVIIHSRRLE